MAETRATPWGFWLGCLGLLALLLLVIFKAPALIFIGGGLGTALVLGAWAQYVLRGWRLRRVFEDTYGRQGRRLIIVYSRSPHWQTYIEQHWLPKYGAEAVLLDWSERSVWRALRPQPVEVQLFERHAGSAEFNPLVLGIPPRGKVRAIRFWRAFRDFKHGKDIALRRAEAELESLATELRDPPIAAGTAGE